VAALVALAKLADGDFRLGHWKTVERMRGLVAASAARGRRSEPGSERRSEA
jgi:hypothetical protein